MERSLEDKYLTQEAQDAKSWGKATLSDLNKKYTLSENQSNPEKGQSKRSDTTKAELLEEIEDCITPRKLDYDADRNGGLDKNGIPCGKPTREYAEDTVDKQIADQEEADRLEQERIDARKTLDDEREAEAAKQEAARQAALLEESG